MRTALLRKDFRLAVPALLTGGVLFVASFASIFLITRTMTPGPFPWFEAVLISAHFCQWSMVVVAALLGGASFAAEREDQSEAFVRSLPLHRSDAAISKLVVALIVFQSLWIGIALTVHASAPFATFGSRDRVPGAAEMATIAAIGFAVLGTSWYWSAQLTKPIVAAVYGAFSAAALVGGLTWLAGMARGSEPMLDHAAPWGLATGLAGLAMGFRAYVQDRGDDPKVAKPQAARRAGAERRENSPYSQATPNAFYALLGKDFRLTRSLLFGGGLVLLIPYVYVGALWIGGAASGDLLARASTQSLWLSCVVFAAWGGYAVAAERASGTDQFLHALPVSFGRAALSRLMLTLVPAAAVYAANVGALLVLHSRVFRLPPLEAASAGLMDMSWEALIFQPNSLLFGIPALGMPLACYAVAWFGAIVLEKPLLGIGLGCVTPGFLLLVWLSFISAFDEAFIPIQAGFLFLAFGAAASTVVVGMGCRRAQGLDYA